MKSQLSFSEISDRQDYQQALFEIFLGEKDAGLYFRSELSKQQQKMVIDRLFQKLSQEKVEYEGQEDLLMRVLSRYCHRPIGLNYSLYKEHTLVNLDLWFEEMKTEYETAINLHQTSGSLDPIFYKPLRNLISPELAAYILVIGINFPIDFAKLPEPTNSKIAESSQPLIVIEVIEDKEWKRFQVHINNKPFFEPDSYMHDIVKELVYSKGLAKKEDIAKAVQCSTGEIKKHVDNLNRKFKKSGMGSRLISMSVNHIKLDSNCTFTNQLTVTEQPL